MVTTTLTIAGAKRDLNALRKNQFVLLPAAQYDALLGRIEDLEDLIDSERALREYRADQGRPFDEYVKGRKAKTDVSRRRRK